MKKLVLLMAAYMVSGVALATFELADPANDIYKEEEADDKAYQAYREREGLMCSVDTDSGECWCIDKDSAQKLEMTQPECEAIILKTLAD